MKTYYSHAAKASDYKLTVGIEYLQRDDLTCQGGVVSYFGYI
jgi:hypothetical protein